MSGYFVSLFWNNACENFDFVYTYDGENFTTINTTKITTELIYNLKDNILSIEINNIHNDTLNISKLNELNIESILFNKCKINHINDLCELKKLKKIIITDSEIQNINIKNNMINIVNVYNSTIPFEQLIQPSLTELYFRSSKSISDLDNLNKLNKLRILNLNDSLQLIGKFNLPLLPELISLDIGNNSIDSIDSLEKFNTLKSLNISNNKINTIEFLKNNPIQNLNISNNNINDIMIIENFTNLEILNIKNNPIKILPNLLNLKHIDYEFLKIDWDKIRDVKGMKGFGLIKNIIKNI